MFTSEQLTISDQQSKDAILPIPHPTDPEPFFNTQIISIQNPNLLPGESVDVQCSFLWDDKMAVGITTICSSCISQVPAAHRFTYKGK